MSPSNAQMQRIEASWNQLAELVNQVQDADGLTKVGADGWSVKDHLAHVAAWEHSLLALIEGRDRPAGMGLSEPLQEIDPINEAIRENESMPRAQPRAAKGGITRKAKMTKGPTVMTPSEIVTPTMGAQTDEKGATGMSTGLPVTSTTVLVAG